MPPKEYTVWLKDGFSRTFKANFMNDREEWVYFENNSNLVFKVRASEVIAVLVFE